MVSFSFKIQKYHGKNINIANIVRNTFSTFLLIALCWSFGYVQVSKGKTTKIHPPTRSNTLIRLFIAIGTAPQNAILRKTLRSTWIQWLPTDGSVSYRFFTDAEPNRADKSTNMDSSIWSQLNSERKKFKDMVFQPFPSGYGNYKHNEYGRRAIFQTRFFKENLTHMPDFFMRVDDDSFLCLHRLLYELPTIPKRQFFWGRFWCRVNQTRADENFMFFSADIAYLLADSSLTGSLLPFDEKVTLGWNFGYWSWVLNLTIFDDDHRLDVQQGYLTEYMHRNKNLSDHEMSAFCDSHIFAHHVPHEAISAAFKATEKREEYNIPDRKAPIETCRYDQLSFQPNKYSDALPNRHFQHPA